MSFDHKYEHYMKRQAVVLEINLNSQNDFMFLYCFFILSIGE